MATLKHIASKNSDYTAIEAYLVYQHDEFSGKVIPVSYTHLTLPITMWTCIFPERLCPSG